MGILENFAAVEIPGRDRLAESDIQLCESHQSAYEAAVEDFEVLLAEWKAACERQRQYLMEITQRYSFPHICVWRNRSQWTASFGS